jgi:iron complex outermembrane receptor protein
MSVFASRASARLIAAASMLFTVCVAQADNADTPDTLAAVHVTEAANDARRLPIAVEVLDATTIASAGLRDLDQLQDQIANLRIASEGGRASPWFVSLRGFINPFGAPHSAAVLYVDGVPMTDFYAFDQHLFDVERIEVRKGPQGAMYGANSESGVIDVVTRRPDATPRAFADTALASRGTYDAGAGISGALSTNVYASLAAARDGSDGTIDNVVGHRPYNGGTGENVRGRLIWRADERLEFEAMLLGHRIDDRGGEMYVPVDLASFNALPSLGGARLGKFDQALDHEGDSHANSTLAALKGTWLGESVQLRAVASWRSHDARNSTDYDLSPQPWFYMDANYRIHESNAELRAQSRDGADARTSWLVGLSADHRDTDLLRVFHAGPGNIWGLPIGAYPRASDTLRDRSLALFGQVEQRFGAAQQFGVTLGARTERVHSGLDFHGNAIDPQPAQFERSDARLLPKLTLDYRIAPAQLVYFSASRGWQPGGFNTTAFASTNAQYRPETTSAYELGMKGELAEGAATYALAAFRNDIRDYQDLVYSETQLESYIANAPRARTQGLEAQLAWRPATGWQLGASIGNVHAEYTHYVIDAARGVRLDGHALGQVPRYNANLHVQYSEESWLARAEIADAGAFQVHDYDDASHALREQRVPGYAVFNAKLGWHGAHWSAYLFGQNLSDRRYFTSATLGFALVALYPGAVGTLAPPRTVGVELRWER